MKYKICKFIDDNNFVWYQVKCKWWIFSYWAYRTEFLGGDFMDSINFVRKFPGFAEAKKYIESEKNLKKSYRKKMVECVEV